MRMPPSALGLATRYRPMRLRSATGLPSTTGGSNSQRGIWKSRNRRTSAGNRLAPVSSYSSGLPSGPTTIVPATWMPASASAWPGAGFLAPSATALTAHRTHTNHHGLRMFSPPLGPPLWAPAESSAVAASSPQGRPRGGSAPGLGDQLQLAGRIRHVQGVAGQRLQWLADVGFPEPVDLAPRPDDVGLPLAVLVAGAGQGGRDVVHRDAQPPVREPGELAAGRRLERPCARRAQCVAGEQVAPFPIAARVGNEMQVDLLVHRLHHLAVGADPERDVDHGADPVAGRQGRAGIL